MFLVGICFETQVLVKSKIALKFDSDCYIVIMCFFGLCIYYLSNLLEKDYTIDHCGVIRKNIKVKRIRGRSETLFVDNLPAITASQYPISERKYVNSQLDTETHTLNNRAITCDNRRLKARVSCETSSPIATIIVLYYYWAYRDLARETICARNSFEEAESLFRA